MYKMKSLSLLTLLCLIVTGITGCSDTENPLEPADLTENTQTGIFAEAKHIEFVPAAPTAPQTPVPPGTPFVKDVSYYSDWQLMSASEIDVDAIHLSSNRIDENQPIGSIVGTFRVPVGKRLSYSVIEGNRDFTVVDGTKLVTKRVFNHEVQWGYEITVRETDRETNESLEKPYTIFINDLNEAPTDLRLTNNTFSRSDGIGTKIGRLVITDEDRQDEEHRVRITQGGAYVGYDDGYLRVLQLFDRATKEIAVEVTDPAGLVYTETFEVTMEERPTQPSEPSEPTPSSQDDEPPESDPPQRHNPGGPDHGNWGGGDD